MKKILLFIFLLSTIIVSGQTGIGVDSSASRVGKLNIQTRDAENIRDILSTADIYDELLDSLEAEFRKPGPKPQNQDILTIDSVTIGALLGLSVYMRNSRYEEVATFYNRVYAAIKAIDDPYLQRNMTRLDNSGASVVQNKRQDGRRRYLGKQ